MVLYSVEADRCISAVWRQEGHPAHKASHQNSLKIVFMGQMAHMSLPGKVAIKLVMAINISSSYDDDDDDNVCL